MLLQINARACAALAVPTEEVNAPLTRKGAVVPGVCGSQVNVLTVENEICTTSMTFPTAHSSKCMYSPKA